MVNNVLFSILGNADPDPDTPPPQTQTPPTRELPTTPAAPGGSMVTTTEATINLNNGGNGDNKCKGNITLSESERKKVFTTFFSKKLNLMDISPFCGPSDTPVMDFW